MLVIHMTCRESYDSESCPRQNGKNSGMISTARTAKMTLSGNPTLTKSMNL